MLELSLQYFMAVAKERSITRAAQQMYISQQGMSAHIKRLEERYHVKLFERTTPLTLTYAGELLLQSLEDVNKAEGKLLRYFEDLSNYQRGRLTVGSIRTWSQVIVRQVLPLYYRHFPNVDVYIMEDDEDALTEKMRKNMVDLLIGVEPIADRSIARVPLLEETVVLVVAEKMLKKFYPDTYREKIARFGGGVMLEEVAGLPMALQSTGNVVRRSLDCYRKESGLRVNNAFESNSDDVLVELCKMGCGLMLCPSMLAPGILAAANIPGAVSQLLAFPVKSKLPTHQLVAGYPKNTPQSAYGKLFLDCICQVFDEYRQLPGQAAG